MATRPSRRASSRWSPITRSTMRPTVSQPIRSNPAIGVLAICWASHATTSAKSRVCCAPARAHGTGSMRTPQSGHRSSRSSHAIRQRLAPRSRWRQRLPRRSWNLPPAAGLAAARADPPAAAQAHGHDHPLGAEAHVDEGRPGQAEHPVQCGGDAHVALQDRPLISTTSSLPPRAAARLGTCASSVAAPQRRTPRKSAPNGQTRPFRPPLHPQVARRPDKELVRTRPDEPCPAKRGTPHRATNQPHTLGVVLRQDG
jgi:hypothetical protein